MDLSRFQTQAGGSVGAMLGGSTPVASSTGTAAWSPANPMEKQYYDQLFSIADVQRTGSLAGQPAVAFFIKSRLEMAILKQVWDVAVHGKMHQLGPEEFYVAMRLIAMAQSAPGQPISLERLVGEGAQAIPLARFEGCPPPPAGLQYSQGFAPAQMGGGGGGGGGAAADPYAMAPQEKAKYEGLFGQYDKDGDGFVTGKEAVELFTLSGMSRQDLRKVWDLADADKDAMLNRHEFNVAMHLIVCVSKKGMPFPQTLPPSLTAGVGAGGMAGMAAAGSGMLPEKPIAVAKPPAAAPTPVKPPINRGDLIADAFGDLGPSGLSSSSSSSSSSLAGQPSSTTQPPPGYPPSSALTSTAPAGMTPSAMPQQQASATPSAQSMPGGGGGAMQMQMPQYGLPPQQQQQQPPQPQHTQSESLGSLGPVPGGFNQQLRATSSSGSIVGGEQMGPELVNDLNTVGDDLIAVAKQAAGQYSQGMAAQRGSVDSLRKLLQKMQQEKVSLAAILQGGQDEYRENKKLLEEMGSELENMTTELQRLRQQRQEEEAAVAELRQQVMLAQSKRAGLLTDIGNTSSTINGLQAEKNHLMEGIARSEMTRSSLEGYSRSLDDVTGQHLGDMKQMNNFHSPKAQPSQQQHQQHQQYSSAASLSSPQIPVMPSSSSPASLASSPSSSLPPLPPQPATSSPSMNTASSSPPPPPPPPKPTGGSKALPSLPPAIPSALPLTPAAAPAADDPFAGVSGGGNDAFAEASFDAFPASGAMVNGGSGGGGGGSDGFGAFDTAVAAEDPFNASAFSAAADPFTGAGGVSAGPSVAKAEDDAFAAFGAADGGGGGTADPFAAADDGGFSAFSSGGSSDPFA